MKRITQFIFVFLLVFGVFSFVKAEDQTFYQEAILSFDSHIIVNADNSADIEENIIYNSGQTERHGIYRDIRPYSSQNRKMTIDRITVVDENGNAYPFEVSESVDNVRIKIGDPDQTFKGQKIYIIKYHATKTVAQFDNFDEIYWNVTGSDWDMPIYKTSASVTLPLGAVLVQSSCYFGPQNSTNRCGDVLGLNGAYIFNSPSVLNSREGMTVAVGFPKGIVSPYSLKDGPIGFFEKYRIWFMAGILPILTFILSLWYWYKKGRDAEGSGTIIPQYDVPGELTPMEVGGIANERVSVKDISSEIIYLATKGYLKISELEEKFIGLIKQTDYELTKLKDSHDLPNDFDKKLLGHLFSKKHALNTAIASGLLKKLPKPLSSVLSSLGNIPDEPYSLDGKKVKLSDLKNNFYANAPDVTTSVLDSLLNKGYYKNLGRIKNGSFAGRITIIIVTAVWASVFFGSIIGGFILQENPLPIMIGIFLSIIIYGVISHFNPAKTEKGALTKEYILGLKDYLRIAEKDRLKFHNAPEKKPEIFEKLLPYAMVLGVADIWAKEFEGIYTASPSWYSSQTGTAFSAIAFSHTISDFSSYASSSLSSSPGGSGSGGGGSSGGGGGGGGGGGW